MKSFYEIEVVLFGKRNKSQARHDFRPLELKAYNELIAIAKQFRSGEITKDEATAFKLKLKAKYELCCKHFELMADIADFVVQGNWNVADTEEFKKDIASGFIAISGKIKDYELPIYNDFFVKVTEDIEDKIKEEKK